MSKTNLFCNIFQYNCAINDSLSEEIGNKINLDAFSNYLTSFLIWVTRIAALHHFSEGPIIKKNKDGAFWL